MAQGPSGRGPQDRRRRHQGCRVRLADWHAAVSSVESRIVGGTQHADTRPYRARPVLRAQRQDGAAPRVYQENTKDTGCRFGNRYKTKEGRHMKKAAKRRTGTIGSSFDSFLKQDGIYEEVTARAIKRVLVRQLDELMKREEISTTELAIR